jgi:transglutaminase-like putative cysteine protease
MSRLKPAEGWTPLLLLTLMLLTVVWSIDAAQWAEGLAILQVIVLVGILIGLVLSELAVPGLVAHPISLLIGAGTTVFLLGRRLSPAAITHTLVLDEAALTWQVRLTELVYRVERFIHILRTEGVGQDNFVFVLQMAVLMWLIAYLSTWFLFRMGSVWGAIVPSGVAILLNLYYAPPELYTWMAVYLLAALLLIVQSNVFLHESEWRRAGVTYASDIGYDFLWQGAVFAVVVILLAWLAPTTSAAPRLYSIVDRLDQPVYEFQREFQRLYSSLNYRPQPGPAYFGDTMTLTGAVHLGDTPIFDAATDRGRYWRGVVYDQYTGRGWVNTATSVTALDVADQRLEALDFELREPVTQTIRVLQPGVTQLHMLSQPLEVDIPARAQYSPVPAQTHDGVVPLNVATVQSRRPLKAGDMYTAVSSVSVADVQSLRGAGTTYPRWVKEKYLQLPDDLPERVKALAAEITAGKDKPYDKVAALESYLRKIEYDESIPPPPPGVDSVDWFLFDQRAGYCDYYASSLITMARSLGIPARLAAGYSIGEYDPEIEAYRQYEYDAHSWPEVFFPKYGWIEFEPTAADPEIVRPAAPAATQDGADGADTGSNDPQGDRNLDEEILLGEEKFGPDSGVFGFQQGRTRLWGLLALIGLPLLAAIGGWILWRRDYRGLSPIGGVYARMTRLAGWLGLPVAESQTPHEYADQLSTVAADGEAAVRRITDAYVLELYADVTSSEDELAGLREAWLGLRRVLIRLWGVRLLRRITGQESAERV